MKRLFSLCLIAAAAASTSGQVQSYDGNTPAYHAAPPPPGKKLPPILAGAQLATPAFHHPAQVAAYKAAAKAPKVMYQLPCYCYCDRGHGHSSLHSCFETEHGANCTTCMQEAIFAADQAGKGKTAKQIREAIKRGDYRSVDLASIR